MKDFMMTHPWMFFWLSVLVICGVDNALRNIARTLFYRRKE